MLRRSLSLVISATMVERGVYIYRYNNLPVHPYTVDEQITCLQLIIKVKLCIPAILVQLLVPAKERKLYNKKIQHLI